jgi:hypothetical protein
VPNNGSFTWNVPSNFTPGRYTIIAATPGNLFDDLQVVIISTATPSPCSPPGSSAVLSNTPQATDATTSGPTPVATSGSTVIASSSSSSSPLPAVIPVLLALNYVQILQITCGTSIEPSYTSIILSGTTTSFPTVSCSASASSTTVASVLGCHSGYSTFSIASNSSVCCPRLVSRTVFFPTFEQLLTLISAWQTSSLDVMYCFTSASAPSARAIAARDVQDSTTSTASPSTAAPTVVVISNIVFTRAGAAPSASSSLSQVSPIMFAGLAALVGFLLYL